MRSTTRQLRDRGIYLLDQKRLIVRKWTEGFYFLFTPHNWDCFGPVDYRLSHGLIFAHGHLTKWTEDDLQDTGTTADPPRFRAKSILRSLSDRETRGSA